MKSYRLVSAFVLIMLLVACNDSSETEPIERTQTAVVKQQRQLDLTQAALSLGPTQTALVIAQTTQSAQVGATQTEQAVVQATQTAEVATTQTAQAVVQVTQTAEVAATQTMQAVVQATQNAQIAATQTREANPYPSNADWIPVERVFDGVTMLQVPVGCFMMGSTAEQVEAAFDQCETDLGEGECNREWYEDEQPLHEVCFNDPFWIDKYEVTQVQFARLGGTQANAPDVSGDNRPVDSITWFEASTGGLKKDKR